MAGDGSSAEGGMDSKILLIVVLVILGGVGGADGFRRAVREARKVQ